MIETTRSLDVVANQQDIFELLVDQHDNFKMSDEELMELIAQNTGITLDHIQLLTALMAGGKGLSWFKESLLAEKPIPCLAVETLETKLDEIKSQLLALSLRQIERYPSAYVRHLVDDSSLTAAIAEKINHQRTNYLMLPCQDTLLANSVNQVTDGDRRNCLAILCVEHRFPATLKTLLSGNHAVDANYIDEHRYREGLLHIAINKGHTEIVRELLAAGADVNLANRSGETPLSLAAEKGHTEIVRALMAAGADVNLQDRQKRTPLAMAAEKGYTEIVTALIGCWC